MKRILVLVEGQTEERFIKSVLQPHLWSLEIHIDPTILVTKRVKNGPQFKGGIGSYGQMKRDLNRLLGDSGAALVTTYFDLYGMPSDVPGYTDAAAVAGARRAEVLEAAMSAALGMPRRFRPFLMVHEYEAVLYCDIAETARALARPEHESLLAAERAKVASPEDINDGPTTHPSRRVSHLFPHYDKALHGPLIAANVGLETIRDQCPHFSNWLETLEGV